jgi:hypothetical protein
VTSMLYSGNGSSTGLVTIGVQESGKEEVSCPTRYPITCTGPLAPSYTQQSSNGTSGAGATVPRGGTMTYTITNLSANTFYSVADAVTGKAYAAGVWTTGSTTSASSITVTTNPLTISGSYNGVVKATSVTAADMCSMYAAASSFSVLPVTLVELKGTRSNKANVLTWKTASEGYAVRFDVERSTDANRFEVIGKVSASGSNSSYRFTDQSFSSATNYYRLRMVDADGKSIYSKTVVLKEAGGSFLLTAIRPNPFLDELTVSLSLNESALLTVSLVDVAGRTVAAKRISGVPGANNIILTDLGRLPKGLYVVRVAGDGVLLQEKVLK